MTAVWGFVGILGKTLFGTNAPTAPVGYPNV